MTEREPIRVDPNTAELEGLYQIPGVGPTMAERILAARPFEGAEDLRRVSGIGPTVLERMSPFLVPSFARSPREVPEAEATDDVESSFVSEAQVVEVKAPERSSIGELSVAVGGEDEAEEALPDGSR